MEMRWTPVTEEAPPKTGRIIISIGSTDYYRGIAYVEYVKGAKKYHTVLETLQAGRWYEPEIITAWMPAPEPYRETAKWRIRVYCADEFDDFLCEINGTEEDAIDRISREICEYRGCSDIAGAEIIRNGLKKPRAGYISIIDEFGDYDLIYTAEKIA